MGLRGAAPGGDGPSASTSSIGAGVWRFVSGALASIPDGFPAVQSFDAGKAAGAGRFGIVRASGLSFVGRGWIGVARS